MAESVGRSGGPKWEPSPQERDRIEAPQAHASDDPLLDHIIRFLGHDTLREIEASTISTEPLGQPISGLHLTRERLQQIQSQNRRKPESTQ